MTTTRTIELTVKSTYLPTWAAYEGVRELVQNAKDAEREHGAEMTVTHKGDVLVIENAGTQLPIQALLVGHTSKAERRDLIGQFGEGLKFGTLALVRAGHKMVIRTGAETWTPSIRPSATFGGEPVLTFEITPSRLVNKVRIEVHGITAEDWKTFRECFLFLTGRKGDDVVETIYGSLLLAPRMKGRVFVKGIFVQKDEKLDYGYDLSHAEVDRDRRLIARWDLTGATRRIWEQALAQRPELADGFFAALEKGRTDVEGIASWNVDSLPAPAIDAAAAAFKARHGEDAVPVKDFGESRDLGHLGKKGVVVPEALSAVLARVLGSTEAVKEQLRAEAAARFAWTDLTPAERDVYDAAERLVAQAQAALDGKPHAGYPIDVVEFRDPALLGRYGAGRIELARTCLASVPQAVEVLVHETAHARTGAGDGEKAHVEEIERLWRTVFAALWSVRS